MAIVALAGCQCESYYCDDTGCYYCDGLGCREVETPDRPTCRGDFECAEGVCTDLGCVSECGEDAECSDGYVCRMGLCVEPTEPIPTPNPGTCTSNAECDAGLICQDGSCVPDDTTCGATGCTCDDTGVCADGLFCIDGECRPDDDICRFNSECAEGQQCVNGGCLDTCGNDNPCATAGLLCQDDVCVEPEPPTGECVRDSECGGGGRICIDTQCFDGCTDDTMCAEGQYCANGRCRLDTRPDRCESDVDCRFVCDDGVCRVPCEDTMECARVASEFTFCQENFCATTNEVTSDCAVSADCDGDEECVDGVCR